MANFEVQRFGNKQITHNDMVKQKQKIDALGAYVAPECEALEYYSQGVICQSVVLFGDPGEPGGDLGDGGFYNL